MLTGTVRLADLKCTSKTSVTLPDSIITQREEEEPDDEEQDLSANQRDVPVTAARARRRKTAKSTETAASAKEESEEKVRSRRQRDFDTEQEAEVLRDSDEESRKKERSRAVEEIWTQNQQKLLELALQQYPKGNPERWDKIAKCVPGKTKVRNTNSSDFIHWSFRVLHDGWGVCESCALVYRLSSSPAHSSQTGSHAQTPYSCHHIQPMCQLVPLMAQ